MKWEYISSTWQPEWVTDAKTLVIQRWKKYRPSSSDPTTASSSDSTTIFTIAKELDQNAFITWKHQQLARRANDVDEYYRYIREPLVPYSYIQQGVYT
jgi:hypothetical protein